MLFISFLSFPVKDGDIKQQWIRNISRADQNGKPWQPTTYDRVCSEHFRPEDYKENTLIKCLKNDAVPTVFTNYPAHKQPTLSSRKRPPPKERSSDISEPPSSVPKYDFMNEHSYCTASVDVHLQQTQKKLEETQSKLAKAREQNRVL